MIKVFYDGRYPNLCSGSLRVEIDGKEWVFPENCLISGGDVSFDGDWNEEVSEGDWEISEWPKDFPEDLKVSVLSEVNKNIPYGCCGGCV